MVKDTLKLLLCYSREDFRVPESTVPKLCPVNVPIVTHVSKDIVCIQQKVVDSFLTYLFG